MPLGDDLVQLIKTVASGQSVSPQDLDMMRLKLNALDNLLGLYRYINPASGEITTLTAGHTVLDNSGLRLIDNTPDAADEDATVKWVDAQQKLPLGTIGSYRTGTTTGWLDIYANSDHTVNPSYQYGVLELAALSKGSTNSWSTWMDLYADGDATTQRTILELVVGKAAAWNTPFEILHNFTTRESSFVFYCSKATTGDPDGQEGMFYYNTFDKKIKMYADGAWRQLATW